MQDDFSALEKMVYSGRGILVGATPSGNPLMGYSLTGRSPPSQARRLVEDKETGIIRTDVTDKETLEKGNPALLIYPAIATVWTYDQEKGRKPLGMVASNGTQTELLYSSAMYMRGSLSYVQAGHVLYDVLKRPDFRFNSADGSWIDITAPEPDKPNYTPRIFGCLWELPFLTTSSLLIVSKSDKPEMQRNCQDFRLDPGFGHMITTYAGGNEKPLKPFVGRPLDIRLKSEKASDIAKNMYCAIHGSVPDTDCAVGVAVAVYDRKSKALDVSIVNRF